MKVVLVLVLVVLVLVVVENFSGVWVDFHIPVR